MGRKWLFTFALVCMSFITGESVPFPAYQLTDASFLEHILLGQTTCKSLPSDLHGLFQKLRT